MNGQECGDRGINFPHLKSDCSNTHLGKVRAAEIFDVEPIGTGLEQFRDNFMRELAVIYVLNKGRLNLFHACTYILPDLHLLLAQELIPADYRPHIILNLPLLGHLPGLRQLLIPQ